MVLSDYQGSWGDVNTWHSDWAKNKLFRVWDKANQDEECDYYFIDQIIDLGHDALLGLSPFDDRYPDLRFPNALTYRLLSQTDLAWYGSDIEEEEDNDE